MFKMSGYTSMVFCHCYKGEQLLWLSWRNKILKRGSTFRGKNLLLVIERDGNNESGRVVSLEDVTTVIILNIGTDKSEQTVQTQIRLLLMEQSDQGLLCLLFCLDLLNTILHCKIQLFQL